MDLRGSSPAPPSLLGRDFGQPSGSSLPQEVHPGVYACPPLSLIFNHQLSCSHEPFPSEDVNLSDSGGRPFPGSVFPLSSRQLCAPSLTLSPGLSYPGHIHLYPCLFSPGRIFELLLEFLGLFF